MTRINFIRNKVQAKHIGTQIKIFINFLSPVKNDIKVSSVNLPIINMGLPCRYVYSYITTTTIPFGKSLGTKHH